MEELTDLIMFDGGKLPDELNAAIKLLQKRARGKEVPETEVAAAFDAFRRYGMIGAAGKPLSFGNATLADLRAARFSAEMISEHAEFALLSIAKEESRSANLR